MNVLLDQNQNQYVLVAENYNLGVYREKNMILISSNNYKI
tara:strand:- start:2286 stop:2405 length:120 start_codon:yes stop_codon:yes gene_type:complete